MKAALFLSDELPIRLAHRVVELENLPHGLSEMPSVIRVKNWYAESFQELIEFPKPEIPAELKSRFRGSQVRKYVVDIRLRVVFKPIHRYHNAVDDGGVKLPETVTTFNNDFTQLIEGIKRRHDPVVTTIGLHDLRSICHVLKPFCS